MHCNVCEQQVGDEQKYILYITKRGQVTLCTSCISKGMRKGSGAIVTKNGIFAKPVLVFNGGDEMALLIAGEEGWQKQSTEEGADEWRITRHWAMATNHYWFGSNGKWTKDVSMHAHECFRRSCWNIRDYLGMWIETEGSERYSGQYAGE